jgi:phage shock protein PspC (stress-responsive transcriptional regulator)
MHDVTLHSEPKNEPRVALPLRDHTILGVCEAIGEDFGFNPVWIRIPLSAMVLWSPLIAIGTYFALGAVVLGSRLLFPLPNAETAPTAAGSALVPANSVREERVAA